jgi:hypothetical protein
MWRPTLDFDRLCLVTVPSDSDEMTVLYLSVLYVVSTPPHLT